jgi:glyoxylase-like metal-dependent hydrolase (beta-lactamase superfamily II)
MTANSVERFESSNGAAIFRLPVEVFPGFIGYTHLIIYQGHATLVDVGSGWSNSHRDLLAGFDTLRKQHGMTIHLEDINRIIISHSHIDHYGGAWQVKKIAGNAEVAIHELARTVLTRHDEWLSIASHTLKGFLVRAGVPADRIEDLLKMHRFGKPSQPHLVVDMILHDGDVLDGIIEVFHMPGHAPGLIILRVGDILLTADHILPETSVALSPESIMPYTGVGHYIESLEKAIQIEGIRLALGGHESPMPDYYRVTQQTHDLALQKVERIIAHCNQPSTLYEMTVSIYGKLAGYSELLKLLQTAARVEYLHQRGLLVIDNVNALKTEDIPVLRYSCP